MLRSPESKIVCFEDLSYWAMRLRNEGKRIVTTNGCFDLLHPGHLQYLAQARALGEVLLVAVNSDESVRKLKGSERPFFPAKERAKQLAALEAVDYVTIFENDTPVEVIRAVCPDIHVKGGDYESKDLPERAVVESIGGKLRILSFVDGYSTTTLIEKLRTLS